MFDLTSVAISACNRYSVVFDGMLSTVCRFFLNQEKVEILQI